MTNEEQAEYIGKLDEVILNTIIKTREKKGIRKSDIARLLGVSHTNYSHMELGKIRIDMKRMLVIMKYLDIDYPFVSVAPAQEVAPVEQGSSEVKKDTIDENIILIFKEMISTNQKILQSNGYILDSNNEIKEMLNNLINK